jgi:dihydrofolate reductase
MDGTLRRTIDAAKKYVVWSTLGRLDWNAELVRGDLGQAVQQLKRESGQGLLVGGVKLPLALAELGLIDEYDLVVHPRLAGHAPTLFAGLSKWVDLKLVSRLDLKARTRVRKQAGCAKMTHYARNLHVCRNEKPRQPSTVS